MDIVGQTGQALVNPLVNLWEATIDVGLGLIGAIIVLIIGYIVGWAIGFIVRKVLHKAKLDRLVMRDATIRAVAGDFELSAFLGLIVKWYIFVLFLTPAASLVNLTALSDFLGKAALWIPSLIAAILVAIIGLIAADYAYAKIHEVKAKSSGVIAGITKVIIVIFTLIIALSQLGIDVSIAENSFLIVLAGVMLALAIGFGLAMKDELKPVIKDMKKKL